MSYKVLLADASVTIQRLIELAFAGEQAQVVTVDDGEQAIACIPIEKPDVVIADINMPRRSGYDIAAFMKGDAELTDIPVLLLAAPFEPIDEARARQVGCDGVLVKPFEPQQVIATVRELVTRRRNSAWPYAERSAQRERRPSPAEAVDRAERQPDEPTLPVPEIGVARPELPAKQLDDYFDRLDAAFATLASAQRRPSAEMPSLAADEMSVGIPTLDEVLGMASGRTPADPMPPPLGRVAPPPPEPPDSSATIAPAPAPDVARDSAQATTLAETVNLPLAIQRGETAPGPIGIHPPAPPLAITDELVDQVARRVLERIAPDTAKAIVAEIVSEIAERLVREEIERIRKLK